MNLFRSLVIASLLTYLAWFLLPQIEWRWMSEDALVIASYAGFGSSIELADWMAWLFPVFVIVINGGLLFFGDKWRILFVCYTLISSIVLTPLFGIVIETGMSVVLRDLNSVILGGLIAIIFIEKMAPPVLSSDS